MPFKRFSTVILSFGIINIDEYPCLDILQALVEIINLSSNFISPFFISSNTTAEVIILVKDAGEIFSFSFLANKTCLEFESIKIACFAEVSNALEIFDIKNI